MFLVGNGYDKKTMQERSWSRSDCKPSREQEGHRDFILSLLSELVWDVK